MSAEVTQLTSVVEDITADWRGIKRRRMFGCNAFFRDGAIFALIWVTGRVGVKLTDASLYATAAALPGTEAWQAGGRTTRHWVLLPAAMNVAPEELRAWLRCAFDAATARA